MKVVNWLSESIRCDVSHSVGAIIERYQGIEIVAANQAQVTRIKEALAFLNRRKEGATVFKWTRWIVVRDRDTRQLPNGRIFLWSKEEWPPEILAVYLYMQATKARLYARFGTFSVINYPRSRRRLGIRGLRMIKELGYPDYAEKMENVLHGIAGEEKGLVWRISALFGGV